MTLWTELARASTEAGDDIILRRRGDIHEIRFNGIELMSNLTWRSEAVLAERSLRRLGRAGARVLVGGLGMGFTLRAALDLLGPQARVTVCELIPEIAEWNRGPLATLAGAPLRDPRVDLRIGDVNEVLGESPAAFDAVLMDTDNGPDCLVRPVNGRLYDEDGLAAVRRALRPGGMAAFWSAEISPGFERRLTVGGLQWWREDVLLPGGRADAFHHIYLARPPAAAAAAAAAVVAARPGAVLAAGPEG